MAMMKLVVARETDRVEGSVETGVAREGAVASHHARGRGPHSNHAVLQAPLERGHKAGVA